MNKYGLPGGTEGIGSEIKWCGRERGGKHCMLCTHHAKYDEWSVDWNWFYLMEWYDDYWKRNYPRPYEMKRWPYAHCTAKHGWSPYRTTGRRSWGSYHSKQPSPVRYSTPGLSGKEYQSLLIKGCKRNKKCKCMSIIQRGNWYCPDCYQLIKRLAYHSNCHPHDIMVMDRREVKSEILILTLSGTI